MRQYFDKKDNNNKFVGVNIGSVTIKILDTDGENTNLLIKNHLGQPLHILDDYVNSKKEKNYFYGVSGFQGHITEIKAIERALAELGNDYQAIVSAGGEAFNVYLIKDRKINNVLSHNRCAAGSGEFLTQQVSRLNLSIDEAIKKAKNGKSIKLASRCSVHCKSDVTHKLNKKEASLEDILYSIHESMANKIISLLNKSRNKIRRILIIGGLSQNEILLEILEKKLENVILDILEESSYFEAFGTLLLTKDEPKYTSPNLTEKHLFPTGSSLKEFEQLVTIIQPQESESYNSDQKYILGIDGGSTTTKVALVNIENNNIIASHYTRTNGDPIRATQECITSLINKLGDISVDLVATTGSAREIISAYVGTKAVYNEISAHARGSAFFDNSVDTIFEIGGQDAKYIYLENAVPIDYSMNAACSAGTGSFLEESAKGDLGIDVYDISNLALQADKSVKFKSECAAFINTDIRSALQEGYSKESIVAGIVNSIVNNYLTKVKGTRKVGKKVFLQGGVAKNESLVYAFAGATGKNIIVPPYPELMGAFGVAILAKERNILKGEKFLLSDMLNSEMKKIGSFICRVCDNYCQIERFDVNGRKFPFGGKCSKYENLRKIDKNFEVEDFVEERNKLIFSVVDKHEIDHPLFTIGIPRAYTVHYFLPLYYTYFKELGMKVIVSDIDSDGEQLINAPFCFPTQIAHGAVLDLINKNVDYIFLPHVQKMPSTEEIENSDTTYLCPITQASSYFIKKAIQYDNFLIPVIDFKNGYEKSQVLVDLAVDEWNLDPEFCKQAYIKAIEKQKEIQQELYSLGKHALSLADHSDKPTILLVGRSYNAYPNEASQAIGKKLSSMGYNTIPIDTLNLKTSGDLAWYYPNLIMNAVKLSQQFKNLFIVYIRNFGCSIDAFTQEYLRYELAGKPFLALEIDSHTADAGIQTRLEAFLEIIANYNETNFQNENKFQPTRVETISGKSKVITSTNEEVDLKDPRVKIYFPTFSKYHNDAISLAFRWLGINSQKSLDLSTNLIDTGLNFTSGKECIPLPIAIGELYKIYQNKKEGDIIGFYILTGGAPCVVDTYLKYFNKFIVENKLEDVFMFVPLIENSYYNLGLNLLRNITLALSAADCILEIHNSMKIISPNNLKHLEKYWDDFIMSSQNKKQFTSELDNLVDLISKFDKLTSLEDTPKVLVTGDFYVRMDPFFMSGIDQYYENNGIILKPSNLNELFFYPLYDSIAKNAKKWKKDPSSKRILLTAIRNVFKPEGREFLVSFTVLKYFQSVEKRIRSKFSKTGFLIEDITNLKDVYKSASQEIDPSIFGESILSIGKGKESLNENYDGVIIIGPFSCLPFRIAEAILKPWALENEVPLLTIEADGKTVSPAFIRLVNVHIQQILRNKDINYKIENNFIPLPTVK